MLSEVLNQFDSIIILYLVCFFLFLFGILQFFFPMLPFPFLYLLLSSSSLMYSSSSSSSTFWLASLAIAELELYAAHPLVQMDTPWNNFLILAISQLFMNVIQ